MQLPEDQTEKSFSRPARAHRIFTILSILCGIAWPSCAASAWLLAPTDFGAGNGFMSAKASYVLGFGFLTVLISVFGALASALALITRRSHQPKSVGILLLALNGLPTASLVIVIVVAIGASVVRG